MHAIDTLLEEFERTLDDQELIGESQSKWLDIAVKLCSNYLARLKDQFLADQPQEDKEEIFFFRNTKPRFVCQLLYFLKLCELDLNCQNQNKVFRAKLYEKELRKTETFFKQNVKIVSYYSSGATEMDEQLFLRRNRSNLAWLVCGRSDVDERFSTLADYAVAKILFHRKLQDYLVTNLNAPLRDDCPNLKSKSSFKWTGESINLVEIAYGIWLTGQVNNGNASVSEIVRWLESSLDIQVGRAYRRWTEISRRDRMNSTKYIDRMREAINVRLEDEDDLNRQRKK